MAQTSLQSEYIIHRKLPALLETEFTLRQHEYTQSAV